MAHPSRTSNQPPPEAAVGAKPPADPSFKPLALPAAAAAMRAVSRRRPAPQRPDPSSLRRREDGAGRR